MTTRSPMVFEDGRTDTVTAVLVLIDGITRLPVRVGVTAQLWDPIRQEARSKRLIRNLSGCVVLLNEPKGQDLAFRIDPTEAGYRGPLFVTFNPDHDGVRRVVPLERRPDAAFDATETVIRGSVVRSDPGSTKQVPVAGLIVSARPRTGAAGDQFPVTTDRRGVFALAVGLKMRGGHEAAAMVTTVLRFDKPGLPVRELEVEVEHGRTHVFVAPIDLDRDEEPPFDVRLNHEEPQHDE